MLHSDSDPGGVPEPSVLHVWLTLNVTHQESAHGSDVFSVIKTLSVLLINTAKEDSIHSLSTTALLENRTVSFAPEMPCVFQVREN